MHRVSHAYPPQGSPLNLTIPCATDAQLATYAGAAPLETSSAKRVRYRLNRGGNRRLNAIR